MRNFAAAPVQADVSDVASISEAEPSSATGSSIRPDQLIHGYGGSIMLSSNTNVSSVRDRNEPCCFQLQPTSCLGSNASAGLCVQGSADVNTNQSELSKSVPAQEDIPVYTAAVEPDSDKTNRHLASIGEFQMPQSSHASVSEDGYSWRKYGQKLVKGSEFPRSYYKCTHPNCEVKKLFERAPSGEIAELMYKGMHDHPKPQPGRRMATGPISLVEEHYEKLSSATGEEDKPSALSSQVDQYAYISVTSEIPCTDGEKVVPDDVDTDYGQFAKRRKVEIDKVDLNSMIKPIREPRLVVQTLSEVDILDDGYRWRKYGQKVVRGNPNPRSYYKCTSDGCPVRKHVERAAQDPKAVITTYEGKHNHEVPIPRTGVRDTTTTPATMARLQDDETVCLDLGVGISSTVENASDQHQPKDSDSAFGQNQIASSNLMFSAYPGHGNGALMLYRSRGNRRPGLVDRNPPLSHFTHTYSENMAEVTDGSLKG